MHTLNILKQYQILTLHINKPKVCHVFEYNNKCFMICQIKLCNNLYPKNIKDRFFIVDG